MPETPRDVTGLVAALATALTFGGLAVLRARNGWAGGLDLGLFDQAVWDLAHGRGGNVSFTGGNIFEDHVSPVLVLFVPAYLIAATPMWLLAAQAAALGATIVPMRRVAANVHAPAWLATLATAASAPLFAAAIFDFHPLTLAAPGVAWMLVGALEDDHRFAMLGLAWVFTCRADASFVALGIAILASPALRRRLIPWGLLGAAVGLVTPHLLGTPRQTFSRYYADLGESPMDFVLHPWRILNAIADRSFWATLLIWLLPGLLLPVFRPRWFVAILVGGAPLLLSSWPGISLPWFHNASLLAPVAIGGGLAVVGSIRRESRPPAVGALLAGAALALFLQSPLAPRAPAAVNIREIIDSNGSNIDATLASVPPGASVAAVNQLAAQLAHRQDVYVLPCPFPELIDQQDDEGLIDVCADRSARPDFVLSEVRRSEGLRQLGYVVRPSPTPGIVLAQRNAG